MNIETLNTPLIGVIGQGWVGGSYATNFEKRGYKVVRYGLEPQYVGNLAAIAECDIVFIAVPTPTSRDGFDDSVLRKVLSCVGQGKIAIIKSTILPGTTEKLQAEFPELLVMHSPEFLTEATAAYDADHPNRNIIGVPAATPAYREAALRVMRVLPKAPYEAICSAREAELIKYIGNGWFYLKVVFINMMYDLAHAHSADWPTLREAVAADPRIGSTHLDPVHKSGRGAGGHCFIKDMEALRKHYDEHCGGKDTAGTNFLWSAVRKNIKLLEESGKDYDLLKGVYGED